ncbi:hypothetical protein B0H10DRAFT_1793439 [Mycena sp. CBHHK59/15]|nr:hypothetical protein B0H10DRAFT_1793439 [Mycena sp. CBHHK59/15]
MPQGSSSAWNPLLRSALESIEPTATRWRGGMDTLLIFGSYSLFITHAHITNTSLIHRSVCSRPSPRIVSRRTALRAQRESNRHRDFYQQNRHWSLSLVLSVSLAALAVTCRGFLEKLTRSEHIHAAKKLTDVCARWEEAKHVLAPLVEALPHLMVIPVALFILGLLDSLISSAVTQTRISFPILIAGMISSIFVAAIALFLGYVLLDGSPDH